MLGGVVDGVFFYVSIFGCDFSCVDFDISDDDGFFYEYYL